MTYTAPATDTIPVQLGVKAYNMHASGTIVRGQGVAIVPSMDGYVYVPTTKIVSSSQVLFGIADYGAYHNSSISVWGMGNIVYACVSSTSSAGTFLGLSNEGCLSEDVGWPFSAILLEESTGSHNFKRVLLCPIHGSGSGHMGSMR
jgi:hypothetical protein